MIPIYPAIDLLDGQCVRLMHGKYDQAKVYFDDPLEAFEKLQAVGVEKIHIVDLNAAKGQENTANRKAIERIVKLKPNSVQVGGGVRSLDNVKSWQDSGVWRAIVGTKAATDPDAVLEWANAVPDFIVAGLDGQDGLVKISGWTENAGSIRDLSERYRGSSVAAILFTSIDRDGALTGPNLEGTKQVAEWSGKPTIVSGGVANMQNIVDANGFCEGDSRIFDGVITGRALYEGKISYDELRAYTVQEQA